MTNFREVLNFIGAEPFQPFRVKTATGRVFEVRHPEDAAVGISVIRVYSTIDDDGGSREQWHKIPLYLVERIEPIQATNQVAP